MAEIKSTLDLVMARTAHLSMSDEEKSRQRREDFEKRLNGLLQQYADGAESVEGIQERIRALEAETAVAEEDAVAGAVLRRIVPDADNASWLDLIAACAPALARATAGILETHDADRSALLEEGRQQALSFLAEANTITGTAVIPRPEAVPAVQDRLAALSRATAARIADLVSRPS